MVSVPDTPQDTADLPSDTQSARFLLTEFSELRQDWRHIDSRIEHALGLYLTVCTILASGTAVSIQFAKNPVLILVEVSLVVWAFAGMFVARRVVGADVVKAEYEKALSLTKRYFVDKDPEVARYLYLPESPTGLSREQIRDMRPNVHHLLVRVFQVSSSLLLGVGAALLFKRTPWDLPVLWVAGIGLGIAVLWFVFLTMRLPHWEKQMAKSVTIDWSGLSRHAGSTQADGKEQEETGTRH